MLTKEYYIFGHRSFLYSDLKLVMTGNKGIYQNYLLNNVFLKCMYVITTNKAFQIMSGGYVSGGYVSGGIYPRGYLSRG